jgi:copper ion binding protein
MEKKLKVSGMTCQHCVARVAKIISGFSGISDVKVDLEKKEARFDYDPGKADVQEIVKAIVDFGYQASEG